MSNKKNWARSVQLLCRLLDTNKQTNTQTDIQAKNTEIDKVFQYETSLNIVFLSVFAERFDVYTIILCEMFYVEHYTLHRKISHPSFLKCHQL